MTRLYNLVFGWGGNVFLLDRAVNDNLFFFGFFARQINRYLRNFLYTFFTDALPEKNKICWMNRHFPLENRFTAEKLKLWILQPTLKTTLSERLYSYFKMSKETINRIALAGRPV
jgi:hypothetical protein